MDLSNCEVCYKDRVALRKTVDTLKKEVDYKERGWSRTQGERNLYSDLNKTQAQEILSLKVQLAQARGEIVNQKDTNERMRPKNYTIGVGFGYGGSAGKGDPPLRQGPFIGVMVTRTLVRF